MSAPAAPEALMEVRGLTLTVAPSGNDLLTNVGFDVPSGQIVGVVGESGSGKSMMSLALLGLLPPAVRHTGGEARLAGRRIIGGDVRKPGRAGRRDAAMVFQNARAALNPSMRVGAQLNRVLRHRAGLGRVAARERSRELLRRVGITDVARVERAYPHQLSGGMCQRVAMAMAVSTAPRLLIADEPTTGLDVTVQAQVLMLLRELASEQECSVLLITHDLGVVSSLCDRVVVLYAGQLMESATTLELIRDPRHPYTRFLLGSIGEGAGDAVSAAVTDRPVDFSIAGCRFSNRCPMATELCRTTAPEPVERGGRMVACHFADVDVAGVVADA